MTSCIFWLYAFTAYSVTSILPCGALGDECCLLHVLRCFVRMILAANRKKVAVFNCLAKVFYSISKPT